jgi:branched-chain amino acid transport system substrate-binding protein
MGYQMCFADSNQGVASAEIFNRDFAGKKIGVFYKSDDDYSKGIYEKFNATLSADLKANMVVASFTEGTSTDFSAQVNALKDCDVIFMPIYYTPASLFMTQGVGIVKANATYYGCDGLDGIDAIAGFDINTIPQKISYLSHFNSNATTGAAAK